MGVSTNGTISFGLIFDKDTQFPWDYEKFDSDIEVWWQHVNGFQSTFKPYSKKYFSEIFNWNDSNPIPVALENYCTHECAMYLLVVPNKTITCLRGYPVIFDPSGLTIATEEIEAFKAFLQRFNIEQNAEPQWILSSFWG